VIRQRITAARLAGMAVALIAAASACGSNSGGNSNASAPSTASGQTNLTQAGTSLGVGSAQGKPCVARKGTLPPGAPDVPVEIGAAPTKLIVKDLKVGTGAVIPAGATITANYVGVACSTGTVFDSSYAHGQAIQFPLTGVIQGWSKGIPGMRVGGVRLLGIPADQAYGANPPGPGIAADEALWFVVQPVKLG
jgi:FKBP-type peptidyl-prolyl cis-trans isomerase